MTWHYEIKEYYDYADDIEGVNIHYLWTPLGGVPDWDNQRVTRFMPLVRLVAHPGSEIASDKPEHITAATSRLRRKILKLPRTILTPESDGETDRYLLHHYFEVFQDGHRHYSPLYTEELQTSAGAQTETQDVESDTNSTTASSLSPALVKK
jgi:hypothetical protein